jgi:dolichol-phosphate mannosyltransferase
VSPEISVVIPLHNESPNVLPLVERVFAALGNHPGGIELVLVDDGSTDDTWTKIEHARGADVRLRPVRHARASGQSAALFTGFKNSRGPIIATLDGDLQNDPADLPAMLKLLNDGVDMVCGVRAKRMDNFVRKASSRIARKARKAILGVDFADTGCNLRIFKRSALESLPAFDGIHRFMPIFAHNTGLQVRETPVCHHPRTLGVSKYGLWNRLPRGIRDLIMVRWFLRRQIGRRQ